MDSFARKGQGGRGGNMQQRQAPSQFPQQRPGMPLPGSRRGGSYSGHEEDEDQYGPPPFEEDDQYDQHPGGNVFGGQQPLARANLRYDQYGQQSRMQQPVRSTSGDIPIIRQRPGASANAVIPYHPSSRAAPGYYDDDLDNHFTTRSGGPSLKQKTRVHWWRLRRMRFHWLFYLGVTVLALLALWVGMSSAISWGQDRVNDVQYGSPRVARYYENLGHGDVSNPVSLLMAINNNGEIEVLEVPGGDHAVHKPGFYVVAELSQQDGQPSSVDANIPVTLTFQDVNQDGEIDVVVHYEGVSTVLYNTGTGLSLNKPPVKS